ncbi:uncharacterized protein PV07_08732 [Cladophialophora immunda]|uniref:Uncharacterized protein n=1 Tax=Cladophialophora immunda TaxID=569365 RepID=A0A0D2C546_9EURO|nr:uncharacterized protein PV07_08732 [Cladophialophora immunda]KIW25565.1 hypothetical protein PV07_08732 [Cladophialophora immunda]
MDIDTPHRLNLLAEQAGDADVTDDAEEMDTDGDGDFLDIAERMDMDEPSPPPPHPIMDSFSLQPAMLDASLVGGTDMSVSSDTLSLHMASMQPTPFNSMDSV